MALALSLEMTTKVYNMEYDLISKENVIIDSVALVNGPRAQYVEYQSTM